MKGRIAQYLSMDGFAVIPLTLRSVRVYDMLLDTTHDLLDSMDESSGQHKREPNEPHT